MSEPATETAYPVGAVIPCGKTGKPVTVLAPPTAGTLRGHLITFHPPMPSSVLDAHGPDEHAAWHAAEHRTRDPKPDAKGVRHSGYLDHTHPGVWPEPKPVEATA